MKALTIWEPWAFAIALGSKLIENRTWFTNHRGALAIHAAKRMPDEDELMDVADGLLESSDPDYIAMTDEPVHREMVQRIRDGIRPGHIVAVAHLEGMITDSFNVPATQSMWWSGPVGWRLRAVHRLEAPVAVAGAQGLWELPADVEKKVLDQLPKGVAR